MSVALPMLAAAPREFVFGDIGTFKVGPLNLYRQAEAQQILDDNAVSPLESVASTIAKLEEPERSRLYDRAEEEEAEWSGPILGTMEATRLFLGSPNAGMSFVRLVLRTFNPEITDDHLHRIFEAMTPDAFMAIHNVAMEIPSDPKDPGGDPAEPPDPAKTKEAMEAYLATMARIRAQRSHRGWLSRKSQPA